MDKIDELAKFILEIADNLSMGFRVRYNLETLECGYISETRLDEYREYLDMDELPDDIEEELPEWQVEELKDIIRTLGLPDCIDPPRTGQQLDWMVDFANENMQGNAFCRDVQRALDSRHPFGAYKNVMTHYGLIKKWYEYRDNKYNEYVIRELGIRKK